MNRLTALIIKRFNHLADIRLAFKPGQIAVVEGPNGAGKSLLLNALEFANRGMPPRFFDGRGRMRYPIIIGDTPAVVTTEWEDGTRLTRTYTAKGQTLDLEIDGLTEKRSIADTQAKFESRTAPAAALTLLADAIRIQSMTAEERQKLIQTLTTSGATEATLAPHFSADPIIKEMWSDRTLLKDPTDWDKCYRALYSHRTDLNKQLAEAEAAVPENPVDVAQANKDLTDIENALANKRALLSKRTQTPMLEEKAEELTNEVNTIRSADLPAAEKALAKAEADLAAANKKMLLDPSANLRQLQDALEIGAGSACPVCTTKLTAEFIEALRGKVGEVEAELKHYREWKAKVAAATERVATAKSAVANIKRDLDRAEGLERKLTDVKATIATLNELPTQEELEDTIVALANDQARLQEQIGYANGLAKAKSLVERIKAKVVAVNALLKMYDTDGVRTKFAANAELAPTIEKVMSFLLDREVKVNPTLSDVEFDGVRRPIEILSKGEATVFGLAVQVAVAKSSGLWLLVVDEWSVLRTDIRKKILVFLSKTLRQYNGNALIAGIETVVNGTWLNPVPPDTGLPPDAVAVYRLSETHTLEVR